MNQKTSMRDVQTFPLEETRQIALLIDPDKARDHEKLQQRIELAQTKIEFQYFLLGGSTGYSTLEFSRTFDFLRHLSDKPIVYFPGQETMYTLKPDAFMFLVVLNSKNSEFIVQRSLGALKKLLRFNLSVPCIPIGYLIFEPGKTVGAITEADLIDPGDHHSIRSYATFCEILGIPYLYLEAGSGSERTIPPETIRELRKHTDLFLIVGGGIHTSSQIKQLHDAGANLVVIGNSFETNSFEKDL